MSDTTATPPAPAPAPAADAKAFNQGHADAHLSMEARANNRAQDIFEKAKKAAEVGDAAKKDAAIAEAQTALDNSIALNRKEAIAKFADAGHQAKYEEFAKENLAKFQTAVKEVGAVTKTAAHFAANSGRYALAGAAIAGAAAMIPNKEVEKADGTTEKKSSLFKKAVVTLGVVVAVGAGLNKFGPAKSWVEKLAVGKAVATAAGLSR